MKNDGNGNNEDTTSHREEAKRQILHNRIRYYCGREGHIRTTCLGENLEGEEYHPVMQNLKGVTVTGTHATAIL